MNFSYLRREPGFYRRVFTLALPVVLQNLITTSLGFMDTFMVGLVGQEQMSAVTVANVPIYIIQLIVFGLQSGSRVLISQFWGRGDRESINRVMGIGFFVAGGISTLCALTMGLFPRQVLMLITDNARLVELGTSYIRIVGFSYILNSLSSIYIGMQQSIENPRFGMTVFAISTVCNTVGNYILIFGKFGAPEMGVEGAAIATVISRYVELAIVAGWTHSHKARNAFIVGAYRSMYIPGKLLRSITIKGMPLLVNEFLWSSGMAVLNQCYSTCGLDVVPAMNICSTLFNLGSVVYLSMGNSVGIIMGQMLGAGHSEEDVRDTNRKLIAVSIASGVVFGGLMAAVSEAFPGIYNTTDAVRHLAAQLIWISAVMMPFGSYLNATYFTLRSGGQTFVTFLFDSCFMWVFCVPLAFCLSRFTNLPILPLYAICQATDFIKCVIGTVMLKQGKWIQNLTV